MKKLLSYLREYRKESILGPLFKLLEASFELIVPLVVAAIIDRGIGSGDRGYVIRMCLILVALGLIGLACSVTAQFFAAKAAVGFTAKLRHALFAHLQKLSYSELDRLGTPTMITRMTSDMNQVQTGLNLTLRLLLRSPFVVFGAMIMAFTIDVPSALIFAVAIPLLSVVVFGIMLISIPLFRKVQERLDRVLSITRENLTGVRVIRAFGREQAETDHFHAQNDALTAMQKTVGRVSALLNPLTYVMINAAILFLIHRGALRVDAGLLTQGQVIALYNYMSQILTELIKLANLIINITKSVACGKRISAMLDLPTEPDCRPVDAASDKSAPADRHEKDGDIVFDHVSLRYHTTAEEALHDISFTAHRGETIGIIGGTGSGKSSLVNLIPRFYEATDGEIRIGGQDVRNIPVQALRAQIGVVPQKALLFHGTIRDNLKWGNPEADDSAIAQALQTAQASEIVRSRPEGLDVEIEQGGRNLSGGQRQRLTIARALTRRPSILILDDSASALDYATDAALRASLAKLDYHPTIFIVSQRTASISRADRILVLDDGALVGCGTHEELLHSCEVYREIYESQFRREEVQA